MRTEHNAVTDYTRGADTFWHTVKMAFWSFVKVILAGVVVMVIFAALVASNHTTSLDRQIASRWPYAWVLDKALLMHDAQLEFEVDGRTYSYPASYVVSEPWFAERRDVVFDAIGAGLADGTVIGILFVVLATAGFMYRGRKLRQEKLIRGGQIVKAKQLAKLLRKRKQASDIQLGEVPLVSGTEVQHILISGSSGTGKTQLKYSILDGVRARGDAAIVYDSTGAFVRSFYRKGDIVLSPVDGRSPPWTPWAEIRHPTDSVRLASSIVPTPYRSADPFWATAAQRLLAAALLSLSDSPDRSISRLIHLLTDPSFTKLATAIEGSPIAAIFSGSQNSENRLANSVRGTLLPYLESLQYLPEADSKGAEFSLRGWVETATEAAGTKPWIFLLSRADHHETLRPLISCWLDCVAAGLMSLPKNPQRRLWFVVDELPSLQRIPSIPKLLAEARQFGAACVLGVQGIHQLRAIYGPDEAEAITDLCNTHAIFRSNSPDTAQWASRLLGEREVEEARESLTYSAHESRDGVHLSDQRQTRPIVLSTEVSRLETLHFFLRLAGNLPIVRTKVTPKDRPDVAPPYVAADLSKTAWLSHRATKNSATPDTQSLNPINFDRPTNAPEEQ